MTTEINKLLQTIEENRYAWTEVYPTTGTDKTVWEYFRVHDECAKVVTAHCEKYDLPTSGDTTLLCTADDVVELGLMITESMAIRLSPNHSRLPLYLTK